jgi:tartrate dehydratase beta subunit/fumarate hydratase class I family protein
MWTETIRDAAKEGAGNTIFIDGNIATGDDAMRRLQAMTVSEKAGGAKKKSSTN